MIRENELIAQFAYLERQVLLTWIEEGVVAPHRDEEGYLFDRMDESRSPGLRPALSNGPRARESAGHSVLDRSAPRPRHHLRALTRAVAEQPEAVQQEITRRMVAKRTSQSG